MKKLLMTLTTLILSTGLVINIIGCDSNSKNNNSNVQPNPDQSKKEQPKEEQEIIPNVNKLPFPESSLLSNIKLNNYDDYETMHPQTILDLDSVTKWFDTHQYIKPDINEVSFNDDVLTATIFVAETSLKNGGIITIPFIITKTLFPDTTLFEVEMFDSGELPTPQNILDLDVVNKWFDTHQYTKPNTKAVSIDEKTSIATILVAETQEKNGGIITINFIYDNEKIPLSDQLDFTFVIDSLSAPPSKSDILNLPSSKEWIYMHQFSDPTEEDVTINEDSAYIAVKNSPHIEDGVITVKIRERLSNEQLEDIDINEGRYPGSYNIPRDEVFEKIKDELAKRGLDHITVEHVEINFYPERIAKVFIPETSVYAAAIININIHY